MRSLNYVLNQTSILGRKLTAITALAAVVAFGVAPIEAGATSSSAPSGVAPGTYACSTSGDFLISYDNGQVVATDIDENCAGTAVIPEGVTKIGLFQWNDDLLSIEIPASVTEIAGYAFAQSRNLATVTIASNSLLTRIPEAAFGYTSLATLRVPARVTSIGSLAFENTSSFTSITFEANSQLQTIERGAFKGTTLSSISLPPSLTTLGNQVFENVASLNSVTFGEGSQLTTIGDYVFSGIGTINPPMPRPTIALPSTVTTIGRSPFGSNVDLTVPDSNQHFSIENGVLFNKNRTTLIAYAAWLEDETYAIPASVTAIGPGAFEGSRLQRINIPSTVSTMGGYAFARSNQLSQLSFSANSSITTIPNEAFQSTRLESIEIPASVTIIQQYAFQDLQRAPGANSVVTQITFAPNSSLGEIQENAFSSARLAASLQIPASVHTIGREAFYYNTNLTSFTFAAGSILRQLGSSVLRDTNVTSLSLPTPPARSGFSLLGWSNTEDGSVILDSEAAATSVIARSPLYAAYRAHPIVTFNSNSGSIVAARTFAPGDAVAEPTPPTRAEYNFAGWALTDGGDAVTFPYQPSSPESFTLYALWSSPVTFNSTSGSAVADGSFAQGGAVAAPSAPTRTGYSFAGWSLTENGDAVTFPYQPSSSGRLTLYALWLSIVTFNSASGSVVADGSFAQGGAVAAPSAPTRTGYSFAGWSLTENGDAVTFPYQPSSSGPLTLYALWTENAPPAPEEPTISVGSTPDSQVATIPVGLTAAELPATASLPKVTLNFAATSGAATATVAPIVNPASASSTPFTITGTTKIVDIQVTGVTGPVTVCLDGASTDEIFHFTGGAWVALPQRTFANGQVCGVTESFSPFAAAQAIASPALYVGPLLSGRSPRTASTTGDSIVTLTGERMAQVTAVLLEGKTLEIVSKSDSQIVIKAPAHAAGLVDLVLKSDSTFITFQEAFEYKVPVAIRVPVTTSKSVAISSASAKSLTASQQKLVTAFVASAPAGAVLKCAATYVSKSDAAAAKAIATAACAKAKKANAYIITRVSAPVLVKSKAPRKVLLSLTN